MNKPQFVPRNPSAEKDPDLQKPDRTRNKRQQASEPDPQLLEERDEYLDLAKRARADLDNYRRRTQRELEQADRNSLARLLQALLPALDGFHRALDTESPAGSESVVNGFRMVYETLEGGLAQLGVESFSPVGEEFDPQWHEALMTQPHPEQASGVVIEVITPGYRVGDHLVRAAQVVVAS